MDRAKFIQSLSHRSHFDVIIIGGGATGLGAAIDAASRGLKTLLLEGSDFAKGTSSRSTKLIHGGLRYLQQGHISLVREALKERGRLLKNAPHLVSERAFVVPSYKWWEGPFFGAGIKIYDLLSGELGLKPSEQLNAKETLKHVATLKNDHLYGSTLFYDGQFDDARLALTLAHTAADLGVVILNYMKVTKLLKKDDIIEGLIAEDGETQTSYTLHAKCIINATGIFTDAVRKMDDLNIHPIIVPSQGIHLVLDRKFLPKETGIIIPHTHDGRVLFMVPWHEKVLVGTTDTLVDGPVYEPVALESEITFILNHLKEYLSQPVTKADILSVFAGIRPLVRLNHAKATSKIARDHVMITSNSKLISIAGGKWTTYRKMGEDVIDLAIKEKLVKPLAPSQTKHLKLHGHLENLNLNDPLSVYGSDKHLIEALLKEDPSLKELIHPKLPYLKVQVVFGARFEMARTVEDILSRRTRSLLLDAKSAVEAAYLVASLLSKELHKPSSWVDAEVEAFTLIASRYIV